MKTEKQTIPTVEVKKRKYTRRAKNVDVGSLAQITQTIRALVKRNKRLERQLAAIRKLVA